ncbi:MAG: hypothetical protein U1E15_05300 [Hyphomicrobiales bacterium]
MSLDIARIAAAQPAGLPRYTSYPPANHFRPDAGPALLQPMLEAARAGGPLSIYMHIPFCDRMCWFCGCHTKQTLRYEPVAAFVKTLVAEIALWGKSLGNRPVCRLHLGAAALACCARELQLIRAALDEAFDLSQAPEISFEIDPRM